MSASRARIERDLRGNECHGGYDGKIKKCESFGRSGGPAEGMPLDRWTQARGACDVTWPPPLPPPPPPPWPLSFRPPPLTTPHRGYRSLPAADN